MKTIIVCILLDSGKDGDAIKRGASAEHHPIQVDPRRQKMRERDMEFASGKTSSVKE